VTRRDEVWHDVLRLVAVYLRCTPFVAVRQSDVHRMLVDPELTGLAFTKTIVSGGFPTWMSIASSPSQCSRVDLPFYDRFTDHLAPYETCGIPLIPLSTKLFKLIRESSDHLLTNLEIPLVAGRKAAAKAVREDERERKHRKDERRRKREGKEAKRETWCARRQRNEVGRREVGVEREGQKPWPREAVMVPWRRQVIEKLQRGRSPSLRR
jgi:hypothetical protein